MQRRAVDDCTRFRLLPNAAACPPSSSSLVLRSREQEMFFGAVWGPQNRQLRLCVAPIKGADVSVAAMAPQVRAPQCACTAGAHMEWGGGFGCQSGSPSSQGKALKLALPPLVAGAHPAQIAARWNRVVRLPEKGVEWSPWPR